MPSISLISKWNVNTKQSKIKILELWFYEEKRSNLVRYKNHGMLGISGIFVHNFISFLVSSFVVSFILRTTVERKNDNDILNRTQRMNTRLNVTRD